jgi:hypothetical protein
MYYIIKSMNDCGGKEMKYSKDQNDMMKHFEQQRSFIQRSINSYDSGYEDEAQRIATIIRILVHDTRSSSSLFKHLDLKNRIQFLTTAGGYIPENQLSYEGILAASTAGLHMPMCLTGHKPEGMLLQFDDWWNQIVLDDKVNLFTRKDLILEVADTDGGAHVDDKLNEAYANLTKNHTLSGRMLIDGKSYPFRNSPVYACIRQIAFELLYSIDLSENIKSFTRKRHHDVNFIVNYIGERLYMIDVKNLGHPYFQDPRVTKSENRKHFIDKILFLNGTKGETHIIM